MPSLAVCCFWLLRRRVPAVCCRALVGVLLLVSATGCGGKKNDQLVVGMELSFPPFEMTDEQNHPAGISVEMARALADSLHKELVIEDTAFTGLIPALQTGKIDLIISSMTINAQRAESIDFSDPYVHAGICLLVATNSSVQKTDDLDQPGRKIAVKEGTTGYFYAKKYLPKAELLQLTEPSACVLEVVQGRADAFIYDQISVFKYQRQNPQTTRAILEPLSKEEWGIGIRKGNDALRQQVNAFLKDFKAKRGLETLAEKYLQADPETFKAMGNPFSS